jgi:phospholipid/cholesterol/gamma-HCH transport system substrate-binding protein
MTSLRRKAAGAVGLVAIGLVIAILVGMYQKVFTPVTEVTVMSDRAGLLLDKGAAVRAYGVPVGDVREVHQADGGRVAITVALEPDAADRIPADVTASIRATTVFGAKFIDLQVPQGALDGSSSLTEGDVIQADAVTVEANDIFQHSLDLLQAVEPRQLNATLSQVASALDGRGEAFGRYLEQVNAYLTSFNPHLPTLNADIAAVDDVLRSYDAAAPGLIRTADQAGTTAVTLDKNVASMEAFLVDLVSASDRVGTFLTRLELPLARSINEMTPVTDLMRIYAPGLGCFLNNTAFLVRNVAKSLGAVDPGVQGKAGFLPGQAPYDPRTNKPKLVTGIGPICYPNVTLEHPVPPHVRFDDGTQSVYDGVGPVVNPGTLHNPYGRPFQPRQEAGSFSTYQDFLDDILGPGAAQQLLGSAGEGSQ